MNQEYIIWATVLIGVALLLFFIELFIPSGGLIGIGAAICLIAGLVMLFKVDTTIGLIGAVVALAAVPFFIAAMIRLWPNTPIAHWLTLKNEPPLSATDTVTSPSTGALPSVGAVGDAITDLRPVGTCVLGGHRTECLADGGIIRAGTRVKVVMVDGMQVKVRPDDEA